MCEECKEVKTKVCKICGEEKPVEEFMKDIIKNGIQLYKPSCKVCHWFSYHKNVLVYDNWTMPEFRIIIDCLLNKRVQCINEIVPLLQNKTLDDLVLLLKEMKLKTVIAKVKYNCEICGKEKLTTIWQYFKNDHHFCSIDCHNKWQYDSITVSCDYCGKEITVKPNKLKNNEHIFCCHEHSVLYRSENARETRKCEYCGKEFICIQSSPKKFCSVECTHKWEREHPITGVHSATFKSILIECDWCGRKFYEVPSKINSKQKYHFCGRNCMDEWYKRVYSQTQENRDRQRIRTLKMLHDGKIPSTRTKPHNIIKSLLQEMGYTVDEEDYFDYYSVDLVINRTFLIEIMGTFWHCDNRKYSTINYNLQRENIVHDKSKHEFIKKKYNIEILYLWEKDIINNLDLCKQLILSYIGNNGVLKNYQSFNYALNDNQLILNKNIIKPYFQWVANKIDAIVEIHVKQERSRKQADRWIQFKCEYCGKESEARLIYYHQSQHHFCSVECHDNWQRDNKETHVLVKCNNCGKEFKTTKVLFEKNANKVFYCNQNCLDEYNNRNSVTTFCKHCNKEIKITKKRYDLNKSKEFYCCRECYLTAKQNRVTYNCEVCGKQKTVKASIYNNSIHHFCGKQCEGKFRSAEAEKARIKNIDNDVCTNCGKNFVRDSYQLRRSDVHFCSPECYYAYNKLHKERDINGRFISQ